MSLESLLLPYPHGILVVTDGKHVQGKEAKFYVGVRHPQANAGNHLAATSTLREVKTSEVEPDTEDADADDDSEENWQPDEDSDESVRGVPTHLPTMDRHSTGQRR